jgi:luciferase family oxidoreductase group 1
LRFSALDSAPVRSGGSAACALAECLARAQRLDELGCHRLWFTEHHLAPDVASSSPLILAGQAADRTSRIRIGAGGVMIRNHAPLVAAEQVVTLSLLHPGRVDLGLGRSGGSDLTTDRRIRRTVPEYDSFEEDVAETVHYVDELGAAGVQVFVLASSKGTASLAGRQGLGLAVAGHVEPAGLDGAVAAYRDCFRPQRDDDRPWVILCLPVLVGETDDEAGWWFRSVQQRYLDRLRTGGAAMRPPELAELDWSASERYRVEAMLNAAIVGSPGTARAQLLDAARRWDPDEVMAVSDLADPEMTMKSYAQLADLVTGLQ